MVAPSAARNPVDPTVDGVRLLLVADDGAVPIAAAGALERAGFSVARERSRDTALGLLRADSPPDVVVVDLGLPGVDGPEVCRRIRRLRPTAGVIVASVRGSEDDEIRCLEAGADDYLAQPCSRAVLVARARALARRAAPGALVCGPRTFSVGPLQLDVWARRAWCGDDELELSRKEFDLVTVLAERAGDTVRREDIMHRVWHEQYWGSTKTLDVHMRWLRAKLADRVTITTVRGVGYRMERARS